MTSSLTRDGNLNAREEPETEVEESDEERHETLIEDVHGAFPYRRAHALEYYVLDGTRELEKEAKDLMRMVLSKRMTRGSMSETQENGFLYAMASISGKFEQLTLAHVVPIRRMQLPQNLGFRVDMQHEHGMLRQMVRESRMVEFAEAMSTGTGSNIEVYDLEEHAATILKIVVEIMRQGYDKIEMGTQFVRVNGMLRTNGKAAVELCIQTITTREKAYK